MKNRKVWDDETYTEVVSLHIKNSDEEEFIFESFISELIDKMSSIKAADTDNANLKIANTLFKMMKDGLIASGKKNGPKFQQHFFHITEKGREYIRNI